MSNALKTRPVSVVNEIFNLIDDQVKLAQLEYDYESRHTIRRLIVVAAAAVCVISAFVYIQVALVSGLEIAGIPVYASALGLAVLYGIGGWVLFRRFGRRDPQAGEPFQGTLNEMARNVQWIRQLFS